MDRFEQLQCIALGLQDCIEKGGGMTERIIVAGGTGLIGSLIVERLVADGSALVVSVQRRETGNSRQGLRVVVDSGDDVDDLARRLGTSAPAPRAFICALGTTRRAAGSDAAFVAVDRDLVIRMAAAAFRAGARHSIVVSSVGADPDSGNLYLRTKGEMEAAVSRLGFDRCDFLRPGLLRGKRQQSRPLEMLAKGAAPLTDRLMLGSLARYRSIQARDVAEAAVQLATNGKSAVVAYEFAEIRRLARSAD